MRALLPFVLLFAFALPVAAQTDLARCQQVTPQFPQACACIIEQAQAAGIRGQTLSKLLVNDTGGVPIITFQAYGAIYVQCIQSVVLGTVPAAPVAPTPAPAPAPAPVPVQTQPPTGAPGAVIPGGPVSGPVVRGTLRAGPSNDIMTVFIRDARPAGTWGPVSIMRGGGAQWRVTGVHDGARRILFMQCDAFEFINASYIALGGFGPQGQSQQIQIQVLRSNGTELFATNVTGASSDGVLLLFQPWRALADALRGGSTVRVTLASGEVAEFGLRGSSKAIGRSCAERPPQRFSYVASAGGFAPDGGWAPAQTKVRARDALAEDVLRHSAVRPIAPSIAVTCDRRLAVTSPIFGYGQTDRQGQITFASGVIDLQFSARGALDMVSQPLSDDEIAALSAASAMEITFDINMAPGDFTGAVYQMNGFAEGVAALTCPAPAGPLGPVARIDASGQQNAWEPADIGWVFDGMSGSPPYTPGAFFRTDQPDVPTLGMQCNGEPFVVDPWPGPRFTVRMEVDGAAQEIEWFSSRAHYFPDYLGNEAFFNALLNGRVLRMTLTSDTRLDVAYSLDGLRQALAAAGCP